MSDDNARGAFAIKSERDISAHILTESKMGQDHSTMEWMRGKDESERIGTERAARGTGERDEREAGGTGEKDEEGEE